MERGGGGEVGAGLVRALRQVGVVLGEVRLGAEAVDPLDRAGGVGALAGRDGGEGVEPAADGLAVSPRHLDAAGDGGRGGDPDGQRGGGAGRDDGGGAPVGAAEEVEEGLPAARGGGAGGGRGGGGRGGGRGARGAGGAGEGADALRDGGLAAGARAGDGADDERAVRGLREGLLAGGLERVGRGEGGGGTVGNRALGDGAALLEVVDRAQDGVPAREAVLGPLGEEALDELAEERGEGGVEIEEALVLEVDLRVHHLLGRDLREEAAAGDGVEDRRAQRVHVRLRAEVGLAGGLLRGHVGGRAVDVAAVPAVLAARLERGSGAGEAEVHHLDVAGGVDHDVLGLDVEVDEALALPGVGERGGDAARHEERLLGGEAAGAADPGADGLALHQLHHEAEAAVAVEGVVDLDDAGVRHARGGARLGLEAVDVLVVLALLGVEDLDRDGAVQRDLAGAPDRRHSAAADELEGVESFDVGRLEAFVGHGVSRRCGRCRFRSRRRRRRRRARRSRGRRRRAGRPTCRRRRRRGRA